MEEVVCEGGLFDVVSQVRWASSNKKYLGPLLSYQSGFFLLGKHLGVKL